ncbi:unnamed protein product [Calicophoron daubneyi]|uniref:Trichohyalin-plectin-homology domain-containing protein n=1 Tax=Calicophoron daubneyi TaxID=300641 RepID=A0AAV2TJU6_CALDB
MSKLSSAEGDKKPGQKSEFLFGDPDYGANKCLDIRNVKVLSQAEWKAINQRLQTEAIKEAEREKKRLELEKMKSTSKEMVKNWTNTFLGARQKKLDERKKRLAKEEEAKIAIDLEEAKYQAERRKAAIEEAKLKLYYQTDRVKSFHTALNLTEVLKERDAQLEFKELCKQLSACKDQKYVEQWKKELEEATLNDQKKAEERRQKNLENVKDIKEQIREHEEIRKKEEEEKILEGEKIRRVAIADQLERERLEQLYKEQTGGLLKMYQDQIEGNKRMKEIERIKEEEEEEDCRIFAAAKKKMTKLRILREQELFKEREKQINRIQEFLSSQMKAQKDDEDDRIRRAVEERDRAEKEAEEEKAKKRAETLASIEAYRLEQIQLRRKQLEDEKQAELDEVRKRVAAERVISEYEAACWEAKNKEIRALSNEYLEIQRQHEEAKKREREGDAKLAGEGNRLAQLEENIFQEYARKVIDHCKAHGRNVYPLEVAARPSSVPGLGSSLPGETSIVNMGKSPEEIKEDEQKNQNANVDSTEEHKPSNEEGTKERLGFVW